MLDTAGAMKDAGEIAPELSCTSVQGDGTKLPFADGTFDRIIASEVMEHVPDDLAALDELTRVLRPGGTIAVTVPAWLPEKICWALTDEYHAPYVEGGHVRIYTEGELRRKMLGAGLEPGGAHLAHALHTPVLVAALRGGPHQRRATLVKAYHQLLEWDIMSRPGAPPGSPSRPSTRVLGKTLVVYATKPVARSGRVGTAAEVGGMTDVPVRRRHHLGRPGPRDRRRPSPRGSCPTA